MNTKHTATPWQVGNFDPCKVFDSDEQRGPVEIATFKRKRDAKKAVVARNAHDDLVEALQRLIRAGHGLNPSSHEWNAAHAALAKAGAA